MKFIKQAAAVIAACSALLAMMPAARAASREDVIEAAKNAGVPDIYINQGLNNAADYSSEQYDHMAELIDNYKNTVNEKLAAYLGGSASDYKLSDVRKADTAFCNASLEEKKAYLGAMSAEERKSFVSTMTSGERNSFIKQLPTAEVTEILQPLIDFAKTLGFNISIEDIANGVLKMNIKDEEGKLVDVATMGVTVDDVGYDYRPLFGTALLMLLLSGAGFAIVAGRLRSEDEK